MSSIAYRKDIDGLRALAVLSVVIFHINSSWLPGGFLGVDIFFVISGYLITSIIYKQNKNGVFSFVEFYNRRIKRILPLFFVVLISGVLLSWLLYVPSEITGVVNSAVASILFLANLFFARGGDYFHPSSDEKVFLHIWSLSVEEQFYFIFPVLIFLAFKIGFVRKNLFKMVLVLIGLLFISSFLDLRKIGISMQLYYLPHLRFMQIMSGAALAIYLQKNEGFSLGKASIWTGVFSLLGLVILFFTKDLFTVRTYGVLFLLVSILTVLLILANKENNIVKTVFSNNVVVWIGKISYSLYLWHWVVLALLRYLYQESVLPTSYIIISIVVMFGLSVVTYYFVEEPIRKNKFSFKKNLVLFYILPSIVVLGLFYKIKYTPPTLIASEFLYPQNICHNNLEKGCIKGDLTKEPNVLVVGDSYIGQLNPFIDRVGKNEGWSAFVTSADECSFAFDYYKGYSSYCKTRNQYIEQNYAKYDKIVFHYYNSEYYNDKFRATCKRLLEEGKQVYLITSVRSSNINVLRQYYWKSIGIPFVEREVQLADVAQKPKICKEIPQVVWIDLTRFIPNNLTIEGKPIYVDRAHWNTFGAEKIAQEFVKTQRFLVE